MMPRIVVDNHALSGHQASVMESMRLSGHIVQSSPSSVIPELERIRMAQTLLEEVFETLHALRVGITARSAGDFSISVYGVDTDSMSYEVNDDPNLDNIDLVKVAAGIADIHYATTSIACACGINEVIIQESVDKNNMLNSGAGHSFSPEGNLIKPDGYKSPDIQKMLDEQVPLLRETCFSKDS